MEYETLSNKNLFENKDVILVIWSQVTVFDFLNSWWEYISWLIMLDKISASCQITHYFIEMNSYDSKLKIRCLANSNSQLFTNRKNI